MTDDVFTPTPAASWVDPNPAQEVELPSGNKAVIKKPNLYILGRTSQVPTRVKKASAKAAAAKPEPTIPTSDQVIARMEGIEVYADWVLTLAFITPKVTLQPQDDAVCISALTSEDKAFVLAALEIRA